MVRNMHDILQIANKCHKCFNANCSKYCPLNNNIPLISSYVADGKLLEASEILFRSNPFPYLTSLLCNHEKQCSGHCLFEHIEFYNIENYLGNMFFDRLIDYPSKLNESNVIIVGGGITGLTISHYLLKSCKDNYKPLHSNNLGNYFNYPKIP